MTIVCPPDPSNSLKVGSFHIMSPKSHSFCFKWNKGPKRKSQLNIGVISETIIIMQFNVHTSQCEK